MDYYDELRKSQRKFKKTSAAEAAEKGRGKGENDSSADNDPDEEKGLRQDD